MTTPAQEILAWIKSLGRPVLWSEVEAKFGRWAPTHHAFHELIHLDQVRAVFPEAKPGDSGRQFWEPTPMAAA